MSSNPVHGGIGDAPPVTPTKKCENAPDCEENGITDEISCDFAPWAYDRCPVTCGTCELQARRDEEYQICPTKVTTSAAGGAVPRFTQKAKCEDSSDCEENGIVDEISCDFTPWAFDRCPATCGACQAEQVETRIDEEDDITEATPNLVSTRQIRFIFGWP